MSAPEDASASTPPLLRIVRGVERLNGLLMPLSAALGDWRRLDVDDFDAARLRRGLECGPYPHAEPGEVIVYGSHGLACSIAEVKANRRVGSKRWIGPEPSEEMLAATFAPRPR